MRYGNAEAWLNQVVKAGLPVVIDGLGLRRNIVVLSLAIFCAGLGEELRACFLPKYLEALRGGGASGSPAKRYGPAADRVRLASRIAALAPRRLHRPDWPGSGRDLCGPLRH
jgi:hypothetical protein